MRRDRLYQAGSLAVPLLTWQLAAGVFGLVSPSLLPPPLTIVETTATLLTQEGFRSDVLVTLQRTLVASLVGSTLGTVVGLAMGWNPHIKAVLSPLAAAIFPLPMIALLPLVILLLGSTETALVVTAGLGTFFVVLWNAMDGASGIESVHVDVARDNGATSTYRLFREVLLPGSLPLVLVGLRLGLSTSLLIVVAVELVAGGSGLGNFLWIAWMSYDITALYAGLVVSAVLGIAFTYGLGAIERRLVPWHADNRRTVVL
ncbi:ABC transporter permease [Halapricum desulfuricans]|uniref:ABC-type nitrate/sulfonate/bicarbonate transportsystem, permease component n=1 Tax=Halapricum desulfuricans TaxID=2841257 RepID=A0A897N4I9_9EURY|nr:ABC transporter permease subunit [Halapricum desulfuricans]QSG07544.1 ABC-type nitrate/sulfonate/bicarbonate transportsystem, permease component [Halapricum desulfuricans]